MMYNEMYAPSGAVRAHYAAFEGWLQQRPAGWLEQKRGEADALFHRLGITFAVYGEQQGTERLINRLIELGKPFDSMIYPNRSHSISEGPGTTVHVYKLIARYFMQNLPAGPR